jgi:type IV pilus assembly protein PilC
VEWDDGFRVQVRKAATYPLILLVLLAAIVLLVSAFSLPPVLNLLEELGIPLPTITRVFLALGHGLHRYGWLLVAAPAAAWAALTFALRRPAFRLAWDTALLGLPVAGPLVSRMALARFAHFFAEQVRAGIPMTEALRHSEGVTGNARVGLAVRAVRFGVEQGGGLAASAARTGQFPQMVVRMLALGEETGKLEETLEKAAARFDAEAEERVRMVFQVLDPVVKVFMACLLVFVAAAVLLPLYMMIGGLSE